MTMWTSKETESQDPTEVPAEALVLVAGGLNPQPLPPGGEEAMSLRD